MQLLLGQVLESRGFLPTRGDFMLDFVCVALVAVLPILLFGIYLARYGRQYRRHKQVQIALAVILLVVVLAFEIDVRFFTDWRRLAAPSPYFEPGTWNPVWYSLLVHLGFAVPTLVLWIYVVVQALRNFPRPAAPGAYSAAHRFWARLAASGMAMTAITGWVFYWLAFVA